MELWRERGGIPLLTVVVLLLAVCLGAVITVATYRENQPEPAAPPDTVPVAPPLTITLDELRAELVAAGVPPASGDRVVEVLTDRGPVQVVLPPTTTVAPTTTTTTSTTTTTMPPTTTTRPPPVISVPSLDDILDLSRDDFTPGTTIP